MRELNLEEFPDELPLVKFNFKEACEQVCDQMLEKEKALSDRVEDEIEWPTFALLFWNHIFRFQKIMTHRELKEKYFLAHHAFIVDQNLSDFEEDGLRGRIYRTYGSLVRDCLFSLELKEELSQFGVEVRFNRKLDIKNGLDILLLHDGNKYGFKLFLNSKRANAYKAKKEAYRHKNFDDVIMRDVPCPKGGRWVNGDIWMYGITDRNIVRQELGLPIIDACYSAMDEINLFS